MRPWPWLKCVEYREAPDRWNHHLFHDDSHQSWGGSVTSQACRTGGFCAVLGEKGVIGMQRNDSELHGETPRRPSQGSAKSLRDRPVGPNPKPTPNQHQTNTKPTPNQHQTHTKPTPNQHQTNPCNPGVAAARHWQATRQTWACHQTTHELKLAESGQEDERRCLMGS